MMKWLVSKFERIGCQRAKHELIRMGYYVEANKLRCKN